MSLYHAELFSCFSASLAWFLSCPLPLTTPLPPVYAISVGFSKFAPSALWNAPADLKNELRAASRQSILYNFFGVEPVYVPPAAIAYQQLHDSVTSADAHTVALALEKAYPAFGLVEAAREKTNSDTSYILCANSQIHTSVEHAGTAAAGASKLEYSVLSSKSTPDQVFQLQVQPNKVVRFGASELKPANNSTVEGLPQAHLAAADLARGLHNHHGLPLEHCVVPFFVYTAAEELHGISYLLTHMVPCFAVLEVCRLGNEAGRMAAARWRVALRLHGERLASLVSATRPRNKADLAKPPALHWDSYFIKPLHSPVPDDPKPELGEGFSVYGESLRQLAVFERLRKAQVPTPLPLARLTTGTDEPEKARQELLHSDPQPPAVHLVFENVAADGFVSGLPQTTALFLPWLRGAMEAVRMAQEDADVVHLDAHLHNFMWRLSSGGTVVDSPPSKGHEKAWVAVSAARRASKVAEAEAKKTAEAATMASTARQLRSDAWKPVHSPTSAPTAATRAAAVAQRLGATYKHVGPAANAANTKALPNEVEVLIVDWDYGLCRDMLVRKEDADFQSVRQGWQRSMRALEAGKAPPTAPDWDLLRTTLALWLGAGDAAEGGEALDLFTPLSAKDVTAWRSFVDVHVAVDSTLGADSAGQLGERDGLRTVLKALKDNSKSLKLDPARLAQLLDSVEKMSC